jgi:hypothetical protein
MSMKIRLFPFREGVCYGNIIWAERDRGSSYYRVSEFAANNGKFPANHPVAPGSKVLGVVPQCGDSETLRAFRERGYWASCFPEGDGITWKPLNGQSDDQCLADINECFGWDAKWSTP